MTKQELLTALEGLPGDTVICYGGADVAIVILSKDGVTIDDDDYPFVDEEDNLLPGLTVLWPPHQE